MVRLAHHHSPVGKGVVFTGTGKLAGKATGYKQEPAEAALSPLGSPIAQAGPSSAAWILVTHRFLRRGKTLGDVIGFQSRRVEPFFEGFRLARMAEGVAEPHASKRRHLVKARASPGL
jgi:hypothetical protein